MTRRLSLIAWLGVALGFPAWLCGEEKPLFSFGVIADCQYCNVKVAKEAKRQYALSPKKLAKCVEHLNRLDLEFVVHLGDFIDRDFESFKNVVPIYNRLKADHFHVLGNHDFEVADEAKAKVPSVLGLKDRYYEFRRHGYRFIALDGNDVSLHAYPSGDARRKAAKTLHETLPKGTPTWNGALGKAQLAWLEKNLQEAKQKGERVVLFCHFPVFPVGVHNLWNAEKVRSILTRHDHVVAYMNGHNHGGSYAVIAGQHYVTFKGMVDTYETAYAVVGVHSDRLEVIGTGRQKNLTLPLKKKGGSGAYD